MAHFDHCGGRGWREQSLLELDLLEQKLVGLVRRQLILPLHLQEMLGGDRLSRVRDEPLDEFLGCCSCSWRQVEWIDRVVDRVFDLSGERLVHVDHLSFLLVESVRHVRRTCNVLTVRHDVSGSLHDHLILMGFSHHGVAVLRIIGILHLLRVAVASLIEALMAS